MSDFENTTDRIAEINPSEAPNEAATEAADDLVLALARVLETRRQELRMSQEELAKRAGLSRTYLSDIERGLRNISVVTLSKIAQALNAQASEMLARAELESRNNNGHSRSDGKDQ